MCKAPEQEKLLRGCFGYGVLLDNRQLDICGGVGLCRFVALNEDVQADCDGLAGGLAMFSYGAFGIIALFQGNVLLFGFCLTVIGWLLSYVWFNVPPARFMMGDTGSFALGAGLGVVAMMTNSLLLLPIIGLPFVVETSSSLIQLISKKFWHRKIFISAPVHHHLEAKGWGEAKIVMRFWIIAGVCAILGIFLAATGGAI